MDNRGGLLRKRVRAVDNLDFMWNKKIAMIPKQINEPNIVEIGALRFKTIIAKADQDFALKLTPEAGIQGFIVLLRPSLPSIS
jgi:hypothetical protein